MSETAPVTTKHKTPAKNKISHRRGHGKRKSSVCIKTPNGIIQRKNRSEADALVTAGSATYATRTAWRTQRGVVNENAREAKPEPKAKKKK